MSPVIGGAAAAISSEMRKFERSAARVATPDPAPDLVHEAVVGMTTRHAVEANVAVIRAADQMTGDLINIWA